VGTDKEDTCGNTFRHQWEHGRGSRGAQLGFTRGLCAKRLETKASSLKPCEREPHKSFSNTTAISQWATTVD
jgi:hypothetical protein